MGGNCVVGIDVGGEKKGFHVAVVREGERVIDELFHATEPAAILDWLDSRGSVPKVIAIDCPPRCARNRTETRLAERQLHQMGFRMQWTRLATRPAAEWMQNGQRLWEALRFHYPVAHLIECFPTAASSGLSKSGLVLPLQLLGAHHRRRDWKDLVDACICAEIANRYPAHIRAAGTDNRPDELDELGPIYF